MPGRRQRPHPFPEHERPHLVGGGDALGRRGAGFGVVKLERGQDCSWIPCAVRIPMVHGEVKPRARVSEGVWSRSIARRVGLKWKAAGPVPAARKKQPACVCSAGGDERDKGQTSWCLWRTPRHHPSLKGYAEISCAVRVPTSHGEVKPRATLK